MPGRRGFILVAEMLDPIKILSDRKGGAPGPLGLTLSPVPLLSFNLTGTRGK